MPLEAHDLTLAYGRRQRPAVRGASLVAERGHITALVGPNGSGKSTLLRALARGLRPASGTVRVDGDDLYRLPAREAARRVAFVPQDTPAPFAFTVREMIALSPPGDLGAAARQTDAARRLDLTALLDRSVLALSGGEKQRAALARALAQNAPYLLLDEPTTHLDLRHQAALLAAIRDAARGSNDDPAATLGAGVVVVLHDLDQAAALADRVYVLHEGEVRASGAPAEVLTPDGVRRWWGAEVDAGEETDAAGRTVWRVRARV